MKKIFFLLLFPCLCVAQYQGNGNQKITLGEQSTADGLIWRGVLNDTALITPFSDTSAYIILDTVSNRFFHYKRNTNVWTVAGGSDTSLIAYVKTYGTQTVNGAKTLTSNLILKNSQEPVRDTFVGTQTFAADTTNWTRGTGWTFSGTRAIATAATGDLTYTPSLTITSGNAYEITYTIASYSAGTLTARIGNASYPLPTHDATNNIVLLFPTSSTGGFRFTTSSFTGNLDNITVVQISNAAPVLFAGQDDNTSALYNSLRMPTATTLAFGGGGGRTTGVGNNTFIGTNAGLYNTTGSNNNFIGNQAGFSNTTGSNNNFFGLNAGKNNTIGNNNYFFGRNAGVSNTTGTSNIFFGDAAGMFNLNASNNIFFGTEAGEFNTTGSSNIYFGVAAGENNRVGTNNTFFGLGAGRSNRGSFNLAFGDNAFNNTTLADSLTGSSNIAIGTNAGDNIRFAAAGNVVIGNGIDLPDPSGSNQLVIKNIIFATGASGTGTTSAGNVGIGTNAPLSKLNIMGTVRINSAAAPDANYFLQLENSASQKAKANAWDTYSDKRIKTDVQPIFNAIDKVNLLNPVYYQKHDSYVENDFLNIDYESSVKSLGFIAQEVYNIIPEAVNTGTTYELWAMDYTKIIPILTKAIQEQQALIKSLEQRILILENK